MSGTISTTITTAVTLSADPTTITSAGAVEVSGSYYAVQGPSPTAWTLANHGTVSSANGGGVLLNAGGGVRNAAGATITAHEDGLVIAGAAGRVFNSGTIAGANGFGVVLERHGRIDNAAGGSITGGVDGVKAIKTRTTIVNAGTISGNFGVYLLHGGSVTNAAGGFISGGFGGVDAGGGGIVTIVNAGAIICYEASAIESSGGGTITNLAGGSIVAYGVGIECDSATSVVNAGEVSGAGVDGVGIFLAPGNVTNRAGGLVDGASVGIEIMSGSTNTIVNAGAITGGYDGISVTEASVTNQAGGLIQGEYDGIHVFAYPASVVNAGTIIDDGVRGAGVVGVAGGTVVNLAGASITGYQEGILEGVKAGSVATVVNAGTIGAVGVGIFLGSGGSVTNQPGGMINGGLDGVKVGYGAATIVNEAAISSSAGDGVYLTAGGSIRNTGVISGGEGIVARTHTSSGYVSGGPTTIVNSGTIIGTSGPGVYFAENTGSAPCTLVNAGTIIGEDGVAVNFGVLSPFVDPYSHDTLVVEPGAKFDGVVQGGGGTLVFGTGLASGIGGEYLDFTYITSAPGTNLLLTGTNTMGVVGTLSSGGSIEIAGTLITGGSFSSITDVPVEVLSGGKLGGGGVVMGPVVDSGVVGSSSDKETITLDGPVTVTATGTLSNAFLSGQGNVIAGTIADSLTLLGSGTTTIEGGVHASDLSYILLSDGTLTLAPTPMSIAYRGDFDDVADITTVFNPGSNNVTLSGSDVFTAPTYGQAEITGSGILTLANETDLANVTLGGTEVLQNSGSVTETGQMTIGSAGILPATILETTTGTWDIQGDDGVGHGASPLASFINFGTFEKTLGGGTSVVSANFVNTGTILVTSGTLEFTGGFLNFGKISEDGGTVIFGPGASPALFNQYASGIDPDGGGSALPPPPPPSPQPTLAAPHPG